MTTFNDALLAEYAKLATGPITSPAPAQFKPSPVKADYDRGYVTRCCLVKRNNIADGYEVDPALSGNADSRLYYVISFPWRISGKKNRTVVNGVIEDFGVAETNTETLKKQEVPLTRFFPNPLEFWRGS